MSVVSLENGSENVCADCEMRLLKLKRMCQCVVSLKNPSELKCIVLVNKYVKSVSLVSLKNRGQCIGLVNKYVKIMSVVSLKNPFQLQSIALLVILVKLSGTENTSIGL